MQLNYETNVVTPPRITINNGRKKHKRMQDIPTGEVPAKKSKLDLNMNSNNTNNNNKSKFLSLVMDYNKNYLKEFISCEVSVFRGVRCTFNEAVQVVFAWSIGINLKDITEFLGLEEHITKYFYTVCTYFAKKFIRTNIEEWRIGGSNVVVIIDIYPEGCKKFNYLRTGHNNSILCIAEAKDIPTKYWFEVLDSDNNNDILEKIKTVVKPGSILVVDPSSTMCSYERLQEIRHLYPLIVSTDNLSQHNNEQQNLLRNLETIWRPALQICEVGSYHMDRESYYTSYLWNQRFGNEGLRVLFNQF